MNNELFNINIEATLLSSLIFDPSLLEKNFVKITDKLFYYNTHKIIINTILDLFKKNKLIDEDIILNIIGREYSNDLINILMKNPISNLESYIDILKDYSVKREVKRLVHEINKELDENISGVELKAKLNEMNEQIQHSNVLNVLEINNISDVEEKEIEYICQNWLPIPKNTVSLITAAGGVGKSWFVQQIALRAVEEGKIKKVFLWLSEDAKEISKNRFNKVYDKVLKFKNNELKKKIDISDSPTIHFIYENHRKIEVSPLLIQFQMKLASYDLIIMDPLIAFYGAEENNNSSARKFMQLFTSWAHKEEKTIIFIHHSSKNTSQSRGASAFVDAVRTVYEMDIIKDKNDKELATNKRLIKLTKDNYAIHNILGDKIFEREIFPPLKNRDQKTNKFKKLTQHDDF